MSIIALRSETSLAQEMDFLSLLDKGFDYSSSMMGGSKMNRDVAIVY